MQDEREPDIMGSDDDALEEKVREMMDPKAKKPEADEPADKTQTDEVGTAPVLVGLPMSKEPLKIKIIKEESSDEEPLDAVPTAPIAKPKAKKKITVKHDQAETVDSEESKIPESDEGAEDEIPALTEAVVPAESVEEVEETDEQPESTELEPESDSAEMDNEASEPEGDAELSEKLPEETVPPVIEDTKTKDAVDDIVAHESDELLAVEDDKIAAAFQPPKKPGIGQKFKSLLAAWWHNPKARWLTLTVAFLALLAAMIVPTSRYMILNTARVRSGMSVLVLDNSTQQPLKNVKVSIGGATGVTESDGRARLTSVKLGPAKLKIEKRAFAPIEQQVTIGWGSNPLGEFKLIPTGSQYAFTVTDYLSDKGIEGVEASSGEASARSDIDGKILLTMDQPPDEFEVIIKGRELREEKLKINADMKTSQPVKLVPARKAVFVSRRSGVYDVYKIDIDGKNEEKILAGTGSERDDVVVMTHPSDEVVAVVSTRDNARNSDGFLLSSLSIIDLSDNGSVVPAKSEQIRPLGWVNERLIYMQVTSGASAANPKRQRLMSYNYKTDENKELFTSNYFNDLGIIANKIYFAPSGAYQAGSVGLYTLDPDGTNKQTVINQEVWSFSRISYDHLSLSVGNDWYDFKLGDKQPAKLPGQPANLSPRVYVDSPSGKKSLWVDNRDGKGVLLAYEPSTGNEQVLRTQSGLKNPVRWLSNDVVIYRINTEQETADYALSLNGGEPQKIRDVTHVSATDNWYYY